MSGERNQRLTPSLARADVLRLFGWMSGALLVPGCTAQAAGSTPTVRELASLTSASPAPMNTASSCTATPEGEIGPYFRDDDATGYNRSNILANIDGSSPQQGVFLTLNIFVYDLEKHCAVVSGSQVDIWHCNASGRYSGQISENDASDNWLRGYQLTDAVGKVTFTTVVPGWYPGRTSHIHLRIRSRYSNAGSTSDGTNTTQLFFPQSLITYLSTSVHPYSEQGVNSTTNEGDQVYSPETDGKTLLHVSGDANKGYVATYVVGLPITDMTSMQ